MNFEEAWQTKLAYIAHKDPKELARAAWEMAQADCIGQMNEYLARIQEKE